ncbi:hypothetical protein Ancab_026874 [Ancistrocladus abbreviatus]
MSDFSPYRSRQPHNYDINAHFFFHHKTFLRPLKYEESAFELILPVLNELMTQPLHPMLLSLMMIHFTQIWLLIMG